MSLPMNIAQVATPALLLDSAKLNANITRMQQSADRLGVKLRPHLKTMKSARAAKLLLDAGACGITVSTLKEAAYFLDRGFDDITYAVGIVPERLPEVMALIARGADLKIMTDNPGVARAVAENADREQTPIKVLIEIDSGDNRGGLQPDSDEILQIGEILADSKAVLEGVLTHAGHSYGVNNTRAIEAIAHEERDAVVLSANRLRQAGFSLNTVSVGSTPTALFATELTGVTELRAGVYTLFDMDQQSRGVCDTPEIAMSVLTTVIGHNRAASKILLDAGGLALSKDRSADTFRPEVGYGQVCALQGTPIPELFVTTVSQEHGHVHVRSDSDFERFAVGSKLRVLPIHACMTAAAYDYFNVIENDLVMERWDRVNGW